MIRLTRHSWRLRSLVLHLLGVLLIGSMIPTARAQGWGGGGWGGRGGPPKRPDPDIRPANTFVFCRIQYRQVRDEWLGHGWNTDYPDSDKNFMVRLAELTTIEVAKDQNGEPYHVVLRLTDPELSDYPFIFMSDVGTVGFTDEESLALRDYLLTGGFLYADDFWGEVAWRNWSQELARALPADQYPIVDVPLDHELFHIVFDIAEVPQVPSIQHWRGSGGDISERGAESAEAHLRGIFDPHGRLMVVMTHNTDIADGWEREGEDEEFFQLFSVPKAYPLGINIVTYALTH